MGSESDPGSACSDERVVLKIGGQRGNQVGLQATTSVPREVWRGGGGSGVLVPDRPGTNVGAPLCAQAVSPEDAKSG